MMERALYNGSISGLSLDGSLFFYENPLESRGKHHRWKWHRCPCCPPNIGRMVASIGSYFYGLADDALAVHLYGDSDGALRHRAAARSSLVQTSNYPWDGAISIRGRAGGARRVHAAPAHAGLVPQGDAQGQRRRCRPGGRDAATATPRSEREWQTRRPRRARPRHVDRAALRQPARCARISAASRWRAAR